MICSAQDIITVYIMEHTRRYEIVTYLTNNQLQYTQMLQKLEEMEEFILRGKIKVNGTTIRTTDQLMKTRKTFAFDYNYFTAICDWETYSFVIGRIQQLYIG